MTTNADSLWRATVTEVRAGKGVLYIAATAHLANETCGWMPMPSEHLTARGRRQRLLGGSWDVIVADFDGEPDRDYLLTKLNPDGVLLTRDRA